MKRIASAVVLVAVVGCAGRERPPPAATTTTTGATAGARVIMNDDAAMIMTKARCQRESACGRVGAGRRFADDGACRRALFDDAWSIVMDEACPTGVDAARVSSCAADLGARACEQSQGIEKVVACRTSALCAAP